MPIGRVELQTGIRQATLRMWERRYGFPRPLRDEHGDRVYPADQVERLRTIRTLLDKGMRPGRIFAEGQVAGDVQVKDIELALDSEVAAHAQAITLIRHYQFNALRAILQQQLLNLGLHRFVVETLGPLTAAVGLAWQRGQIPIRCEHAYVQQTTALLYHALAGITPASRRPCVVLGTPTGEMHALGILMAEAVLVTQGAHCIQLGPDIPLSELVDTAHETHADIVALSLSACYPRRNMQHTLEALRCALPPSREIWIGGAAAGRLRDKPAGVVIIDSLSAIAGNVSSWRRRHASP